ncbi:MAG: hypothetical protein GX326_00520 [Clostridiaceae bacterium]|nr:hypothetical protein [Clostridiaceae bacterium]
MNALKWIENNFFVSFVFGAILSLFISTNTFSILNIAKNSRNMVINIKPLNAIYSRYNSVFVPFWTIFISVAIAVLCHLLLEGSFYTSYWLYFFMNVFFSLQLFSFKDRVLPVIGLKRFFLEQGTYIGLAKMQSLLDIRIKENDIARMYRQSIRLLLDQLVRYFLIPLIILSVSSWPFCFLYLAFALQARAFQMQNVVLDFLYTIPYNIWITVLRFLIRPIKVDKEIKNVFVEKFLGYKQFLPKKGKQSQKNDITKPLKEKVGENLDQTDNHQSLTNKNDNLVIGKQQKDTINLEFLSIFEILYLTSISLQFIIFAVLFYLKTILFI